MQTLAAIGGAIQEYAWRILWMGAVLSVFEFALPRSRHGWVSRTRAVLFWGIYILITASLLVLFQIGWSRLGLQPWAVLRIGEWFKSDNVVLAALGYILPPILAGVVGEFFYYWFHRLQHAWPLLWRFHAVHHSIREMSAWNSNHHFTEEIFRIPFVTIPLSLFISPDPGPIVPAVALILGMQGLLAHSCTRINLGPIRYVVADNRFHRIHHSIEDPHRDRNFGSFTSVWDTVFGTAYFPARNEWPDVGLAEVDEPKDLTDFLFRPFRRRPLDAEATPADRPAV